MPGKFDELAAVAQREARRSESLIAGSSKLGPSTRTTRAQGSENVTSGVGAARRSPRLGGGGSQCLGASRLARTSAGTRVSGALNDITNVSSGRPVPAYAKKPSALGQASVAVPERMSDFWPVAPAATQAPAPRQLSARGPGDAHSHVPPPVAALPTVAAALAVEASPFQGDADNAQSVHEYASEIFSQLFREQAVHLPRANYMDSQTDINGKMRAILIDWLIEVHMKYRLRPETLFLTVNLIDRYLSSMHVMRKRLQLVGVVAMFIASKFEEINPPEVQDFVHITDNAYTKDDVLTTECTMLTTLNFQIVVPTAAHFFERLQKANRCDEVHKEVAEYLLELSLLDLRMLRHQPSLLVSAALMLSNDLVGKRPLWPQIMVQHSRHAEQELQDCFNQLRELHRGHHEATNQLQAVKKKFSLPQRKEVARKFAHNSAV